MKSWFIFAAGLSLGVILGAFAAAFLLDDTTTPARVPHPAVVAKTKPRPTLPKTSPPAAPAAAVAQPATAPDGPPVALTAEAVNPEGMPASDENEVISTARTETPPPAHSPQ